MDVQKINESINKETKTFANTMGLTERERCQAQRSKSRNTQPIHIQNMLPLVPKALIASKA